MDTLHSVMRNLHNERKAGSDKPPAHVSVFRDFVAHLDRMSREVQRTPRVKALPRNAKRRGKR